MHDLGDDCESDASDDEKNQGVAMRKNLSALALWMASTVTNDKGEATLDYKVLTDLRHLCVLMMLFIGSRQFVALSHHGLGAVGRDAFWRGRCSRFRAFAHRHSTFAAEVCCPCCRVIYIWVLSGF